MGHWFDDSSKRLDNFLNHVKLGKGFIDDMKKTFKDLGDVVTSITTIIGKFAGALLPIGVGLLGIIGPFSQWVADIVKLVPSGILGALVTGVVALAVGLKAVAIAQGLLDAAADMNPYVIAIAAAVAIVILLVKYWKDLYQWGVDTHVAIVNAWKSFAAWFGNDVAKPVVGFFKSMWTDIRNDAQTAWNFLDHDIFQPIADFFVRTFKNTLDDFKTLWKTVWDSIEDVVKAVWGVLKPIFDTMITAIEKIVGGVKAVWSFLFKGGGSLQGSGLGGGGIPGITSTGGGIPGITSKASGTIGGGGIPGITIYVDARGHSDPTSVSKATHTAIYSALPALRAALSRGAA